MTDALASQVAAGEVVERPASVLKELLENSLDAGSDRVEVKLEKGGKSLLKVVDNGSGMDRHDALLSLERHATSKLRTKEDLGRIVTLGFRGEALPSIASVSRFRLATRERSALSGTEIIIEGGKMQNVKDWGGAEGTEVEVRSLFFNVPARRKFLRSEETESAHCESVVRIQAMANPSIGFSMIKDGRPIFHLAPGMPPRDRLAGFLGVDIASRLLEVKDFEHRGVRINGFIGPGGLSRGDRSLQMIFLNRRPVESVVLTHGLREGYHNALMKGQYPLVFLFVEMDPGEYDINVHPAKKEVRFRDGYLVREAIAKGIGSVLLESGRAPSSYILPGRDQAETLWKGRNPVAGGSATVLPETPDLIPRHEQTALRRDWGDFPLPPPKPASSESVAPPSVGIAPPVPSGGSERLPEKQGNEVSDYRIIGLLHRLYVLLEGPEGLVLMDQHAAHERVLFERMKKANEAAGVSMQKLLVPFTWELPPRDHEWLLRQKETLLRLGVSIDSFGANTIVVDAIPALAKVKDPQHFLRDVLEELKEVTSRSSSIRLGEDVVASTVCRHAVKANDPLSLPELQGLLQDLFACEMPFCCPHGRPTLVQISTVELERKFGRRAP